MIISIFLIILSFFISVIAWILPTWSVWPDDILVATQYFAQTLANLNFIIPVDTFFTIIIFLINFLIYFLTAKIILKVFNYFRGADGL